MFKRFHNEKKKKKTYTARSVLATVTLMAVGVGANQRELTSTNSIGEHKCSVEEMR